jgi:hypothetical protein
MNVKASLIILFVGLTIPAGAVDRVSIKVSPTVAFAPANLLVQATVDVSAENRALEVIAESPEFYRSSEITLDGDRAPRVTLMQFKSMPSGVYQVRAVVRGVEGKEFASTGAKVNIVEAGF